jgi:hypothetical protein
MLFINNLHFWFEFINLMIYMIMVYQFTIRARMRTEATRAFYTLAGIFTLCGISRFLPYVITVPLWLDILLMAPLIGAGLWFVFRQEILHISEALERDQTRINELVDTYKKHIKKDGTRF